MNPSTLIRRTPAGDAELAAPASGLSISQRRFLTFLDTPATFDQVAAGQRLEREKAERDVARLAQAGLIEPEMLPPAANDADSARTPVRLGPPRVARLLPIALVVAGVLAWFAWQQFAPSPAVKRAHAGTTKPPAANDASTDVPEEPPVIATRTLRSDTPERQRDPAKDRAKASDAKHLADTAKSASAAAERSTARERDAPSGGASSLADGPQWRDAAPPPNAASATQAETRARTENPQASPSASGE